MCKLKAMAASFSDMPEDSSRIFTHVFFCVCLTMCVCYVVLARMCVYASVCMGVCVYLCVFICVCRGHVGLSH